MVRNKEINPYVLSTIVAKAQVFARMQPDDKALLVKQIMEVCGVYVGMCGDGANDCAALKAASVGISLSEAEASIAAPFTSQITDITSVTTLLIEGRAAMCTSFQAFKFVMLYALIQFMTCLIIYMVG
jgi:cation-transporting ATPase 13A3/4/5